MKQLVRKEVTSIDQVRIQLANMYRDLSENLERGPDGKMRPVPKDASKANNRSSSFGK